MKCAVCGTGVESTFLEKILGGYVRDAKGKRKVVCPACQKSMTIEQIRAKL